MNRRLKLIENIIFISGLSLSVYTLVTTYLLNKNLPAGVCPVNNNRYLLYISIGLLLVSVVFPYVAKLFVGKNVK